MSELDDLGLNYERDVQIDPDALDVCWLEQADLMYRYSRYAALAKRRMDEAKERLDFVVAQLDYNIRKSPELYGITRLTESVVQNTIVLQDEYRQASKEYIEAKYEYEVALAAVRAIDQRKSALENLVKLLGVAYFAGPKTPRDLSAEASLRKSQQIANTKVRIGRARREES